jgi:cation:H+ antiporter
MSLLQLGLGLVLLVAGAELLVRGASRLAISLGVAPLLVGLTVVAFGTSAPELFVSVGAKLSGDAELAVGNVVGSNTFNVLVILGLSALISPLRLSSQLVRLDVPLMVTVSVLTVVLALDGTISRVEGILLCAGLAAYLGHLWWIGRPAAAPVRHALGSGRIRAALVDVALVGFGLALLVGGSRLTVTGARAVALDVGISELLVALTVVAAGTSLPELATSVVAALRGERDLAVGNVVGSNLFNLLGILGLSAVVGTGGLSVPNVALHFDLPVMALAAATIVLVIVRGRRIGRTGGAALLLAYVVYTGLLGLGAAGRLVLPSVLVAGLLLSGPLAILAAVVAFAHRKPRSPLGLVWPAVFLFMGLWMAGAGCMAITSTKG